LAYYVSRPKDPKMTRIAGYSNQPNNMDYEESINITRGLRDRDLISASVVLNLSQKTVVRNGFNSNRDFPSWLAHFQESYPEHINPIIAELYKDELNETSNDVRSQEEKERG